MNLLSGDDQGRVNLLHLMVLFVILPLLGLFSSIISLVIQRPINMVYFITALPIWSKQSKLALFDFKKQGLTREWMLVQAQFAAIIYSFTGIACFLVALLITDVNFIWRSTLLSSQQFFTTLNVLSWPWSFWDMAQPSLSLVEYTKDSRLTQEYQNLSRFGQWWRFLLATQLFYGLIPRLALLAVGILTIKRKQKIDAKRTALATKTPRAKQARPKTSTSNKAIIHTLPPKIQLVNWASVPYCYVENIFTQSDVNTSLPSGTLVSDEALNRLQHSKLPILILVKAWEPPLAELGDCMQISAGFVFPVDLTLAATHVDTKQDAKKNTKETVLKKPKQEHLEEWQRFIESYAEWQLFQPETWPKECNNAP